MHVVSTHPSFPLMALCNQCLRHLSQPVFDTGRLGQSGWVGPISTGKLILVWVITS
jgi:hypothetical protein